MVWWFVCFAGGTACASHTGGFPYIWNAEAHPGIQPLTCEEQEPIAHKDVETSGLCRSVGFSLKPSIQQFQWTKCFSTCASYLSKERLNVKKACDSLHANVGDALHRAGSGWHSRVRSRRGRGLGVPERDGDGETPRTKLWLRKKPHVVFVLPLILCLLWPLLSALWTN